MYENLTFLQKKWLTNAKSRPRDLLFEQIVALKVKNTLKYLTTLFGISENKMSLGVHSP